MKTGSEHENACVSTDQTFVFLQNKEKLLVNNPISLRS